MQLPEIKVPFVPVGQLDLAAREMLEDYARWKGQGVKPPIDVDDIVEHYLGLELEFADLKEELGIPDVLGATWFDRRRICIDSSLEGNDGRLAFTVAHEIGHWVLHRPLYEKQKETLLSPCARQDEKAAPAIVCRTRARKEPAERQADQFAARILMPAGDVAMATRAVCRELPFGIDGLEAARKQGRTPPYLSMFACEVKCAGNFSNVSMEAMSYRLLELELVGDTTQYPARRSWTQSPARRPWTQPPARRS